METLNISLEKQHLIKYYKIKRFILLKIQNVMDTCFSGLQIDKKVAGTSGHRETGINLENWQLAKEIHKLIFRKFEKFTKYIKDNKDTFVVLI